MKKVLLFSALIFFIFPSFAQKKDKRFKDIDEVMEEILDTWKGAGFSVAVVEKDQVVFAKGYGYRDYEKKLPATENTVYAIGSCTKAFTSTLMGQLEADGKIKLTDHPSKHIPGLTFSNNELNTQLQIKDLMCHRTGLPRHDFAWYLFQTNDRDELVAKLEYLEPFAGIREMWYYNNFMFLLQGVIAEKLTGKSWEENIQGSIFDSLGMTNSYLSLEDWKACSEPAKGYRVDKEKNIKLMDYYDIAAMGPAGSINSSVLDMSKWVMAWINGHDILPSSYARAAMGSQAVIGSNLPSKEHPDLHVSNYGFGWFLSSYKGHYRVEHGGNIDGFSANTCFFPSDSIGIVVLTNQNGSSLTSIVRNTLADRMMGLERTDWNKEIKERRDEAEAAQEESEAAEEDGRKKNTRPSHALAEFGGEYESQGYGTFRIDYKNDSLFADFGVKKFWLRHYHYDFFEMVMMEGNVPDTNAVFPTVMDFRTGISGDIKGMEVPFEPNTDPIMFSRTPDLLEMTQKELEKYTGEFAFRGMTSKTYSKDDKILYLSVPGQPEYELLAVAKHEFLVKNLDGFKLKFEEGDKGTIEVVNFIQPNGTFKAERVK